MASAGEGADRRHRTPDRHEPTRQRAFRAHARPVLCRGRARRGRGRPAACARRSVGRAAWGGARPAATHLASQHVGAQALAPGAEGAQGRRSPRHGCAAPCTTGLAHSGRRIPAGLGALPGCWLPGRCPAGPPSRPKSDARLLKDSDGLSSSPTMRTCVERPITSCSLQRECDKQREGT